MSTPVIVSGVTYRVPAYTDTGWAQGQGNVSQLLIALAAAVGSTPNFLSFLLVQSTPVSVLSGRTLLVDTSSIAITLDLPSPAANFWFIVKDKKGTSTTNAITLHRFGSEKIDGTAQDATLSAPFGSWMFFSDGTDWYSGLYV